MTERPLEHQEFRTLVSDMVYTNLQAAGNICRILCPVDPDLLDSISEGIYRFIADGDVFEQVIRTMMERDPELFARLAAQIREHLES